MHNEIESLVRESMRYDGGLQPLPAEPLVRRARRRRLAYRAVATTSVVGIAAAVWAVLPSPQTQVDVIAPAGPPVVASTPVTPVVKSNATERVTTPGGAVINVTPNKLCVGNTHAEPACLTGADPVLEDSSAAYGWQTTSTEDFVYAWLTPASTVTATLQLDDAPTVQADLYQIQGRQLLLAVVTGINCWTSENTAVQAGTDVSGNDVYQHTDREGTCP